MVLDLHPIGSSRAPSLCLCTGRNASGRVALPWVVAKRAPRRHRLSLGRLGTQRHEILGWPEARADPTSGIQRLVSYLVRSTPSGNVRVSTRLRFTQLSRAVKNGVPLPTKT